MTTVSTTLIAYIATQVIVTLSNWETTHKSPTGLFCVELLHSRTDTVTNSNHFYKSILEDISST